MTRAEIMKAFTETEKVVMTIARDQGYTDHLAFILDLNVQPEWLKDILRPIYISQVKRLETLRLPEHKSNVLMLPLSRRFQ